jgi:hypothetical protein
MTNQADGTHVEQEIAQIFEDVKQNGRWLLASAAMSAILGASGEDRSYRAGRGEARRKVRYLMGLWP